MAASSYARTSFLGGEVSKLYQGRFDKPEYPTFLSTCLNGFPIETGAHVRRPGTRWAGWTRGGAPGRVIKFDVKQATPYQLEFTDGHIRAWQGATIVAVTGISVVGISSATPAVVEVAADLGIQTGDQVYFPSTLQTTALSLQGRVFACTRINSTHFSIADAVTGAAVDGSTIGTLSGFATVLKIFDLASPYVNGIWADVRAIQSETSMVLLHGSVSPRMLTLTTGGIFTLSTVSLLDGPYLDPFTNGAQVTPNQKTGLVTLTISFPAYVATTAYQVGSFVSSGGVNYISLVDQNVGSAPPSANWAATSTNAAINDGRGFLGTDVGRLIRLYSIPAAWAAGSTYAASTAATPVVVSYNPTGAPGAETFWQSLVGSNTGFVPGTDLTHWGPVTTGAALWTWGKIISLANMIVQEGGPVVAHVGTLTGNGNLPASFSGATSKASASCSAQSASALIPSIDGYIGQNYSTAQTIAYGTIYPSNDQGFVQTGTATQIPVFLSLTINLRAKATAPASASDGTLLGSTGAIANSTSAVTIISTDQTTTWNYVWFEIIATWTPGLGVSVTNNFIYSAQAQFFNPPGTGAGNAIVVQLLGPALLYTQPISTWRLGAYSDTTGWPTCGCYSEHDGRIFLAGATPNRVDACYSNGFVGTSINFAPTDQTGVVTAAHAVTAKFNSEGSNPVFWLFPDDQGVIIGTQAREYLLFAPTAGSISPLNVDVKARTKGGAAFIQPVRTEHTTVFVQRYGRKINEMFPDVFSGKYTVPNLAEKAMHLTRNGILELTYQQAVTPIIWARDADGNLRGITYKRDTLTTAQGPTFAGWHRHELGSGRTVESISVGPSVGGNLDSLTMVTNDPATGLRFVEIITDEFDEEATLPDAWFLDAATFGTSYSVSTSPQAGAPYGGLTVNGLTYLNGKTVQAWVCGVDCGLQENGTVADFVVASGSIFVPFGDGVSGGNGAGQFTAALMASFASPPIVVGFTYNSDVQLVRAMKPEEAGSRTGPGLGKRRRSNEFAMLVNNAGQGKGTLAGAGLLVGTSFDDLAPVLFKTTVGGGSRIATNVSFSGVHWDTLESETDFDNMFCWRVTRPYPLNVAAVEIMSQGQA